VCPAVEFPVPVTDPVADAFAGLTEPDAVTAFTANAPARAIARTAIRTTTLVFTRVHLLRLRSSRLCRERGAIRVLQDDSRISCESWPDFEFIETEGAAQATGPPVTGRKSGIDEKY
jgi:hypothetical protein